MAKATRQEVYSVVLELTEVEAEVLVSVVGGIVGSPHGPRIQTDAIYNALLDAGVAPQRCAFDGKFPVV